jgi:hypothetical protein
MSENKHKNNNGETVSCSVFYVICPELILVEASSKFTGLESQSIVAQKYGHKSHRIWNQG